MTSAVADTALWRLEVIPWNHDCVFERCPVQAGTISDLHRIGPQPESRWRKRVGTDEHVVIPAVVVAFEFENFRTSRNAARQADGRHHGFGACIRETNSLRV